jgi:hypothetical protein
MNTYLDMALDLPTRVDARLQDGALACHARDAPQQSARRSARQSPAQSHREVPRSPWGLTDDLGQHAPSLSRQQSTTLVEHRTTKGFSNLDKHETGFDHSSV